MQIFIGNAEFPCALEYFEQKYWYRVSPVHVNGIQKLKITMRTTMQYYVVCTSDEIFTVNANFTLKSWKNYHNYNFSLWENRPFYNCIIGKHGKTIKVHIKQGSGRKKCEF